MVESELEGFEGVEGSDPVSRIGAAVERPWHLLAGLCLGLSFDVHPNSLAFMPLVGLCYLTRFGWRGFLSREAWLYVAGIAVGAIYYTAVRIAPDPQHFLEAFQYWIGVDKRPPALSIRSPRS